MAYRAPPSAPTPGFGKRPRLDLNCIGGSGESEVEVIRETTGGQVKVARFDWNMKGYDILRASKQLIESQVFECQIKNRVLSRWQFELTTCSMSGSSWIEWIGIRLKLVGVTLACGTKPVAQQNIWCKAIAEVPTRTPGINETRIITDNGGGHADFSKEMKPGEWVTCNVFLRRDWGSEYLYISRDGTLTISLELSVLSILPAQIGAIMIQSTLRGCPEHKYPFADLEGDSETADVTIISRDSVKFPAHRMILSKSSSVFGAMLRSDMEERRSGIIRCEDLSGKCVQILLHLIYSGNLAEEWKQEDTLWELTYAADKYQFQELLDFLDENLWSVCELDNALKMLRLVNQISLKKAEKDLLHLVKTTIFNAEELDDVSALCKKVVQELE